MSIMNPVPSMALEEVVVATRDNLLAECLDEFGMSLADLYRRILLSGGEVSVDTLSKIKNKQRDDMLLSTADTICGALGMPLDEVFPPREQSQDGKQSGGG